jgi:hypothetical protein
MTQHEKLQKSLAQLQAQLDELRELDPAVAAHLDATIQQAQSLIGNREAKGAEHESTLEQVQDALVRYEATHPTLAGTLRSVIDGLAQMGI